MERQHADRRDVPPGRVIARMSGRVFAKASFTPGAAMGAIALAVLLSACHRTSAGSGAPPPTPQPMKWDKGHWDGSDWS